ncbi:MAG TPA: hypothetical protein VMF56_11390 [Acidobacteriaceae bacterium]|nr:hypothetical protein [Acidobacteriaceae bacterium]
MPNVDQAIFDIPGGIGLRQELSLRNLQFASRHGYLYELSDGQVPSVIFGRDDKGRHGNFHPESYRRICASDRWARRLEKVHTAYKRSRFRSNWQWKELDCCNSSDALLMSIFCYPDVLDQPAVRALLGIESKAIPEFGFKPRTPLHSGKRDNTEIDMKIGELLVEAKLTESNFQFANIGLISRYRDLEAVFDIAELPTCNGKQCGYQLIRGALAAFATGCSFCVFCDARRPDLVESWYSIMRAVRPFELRCRLKLLTWQELASVLPKDLQQFLSEKYGITPAASRGISLR